MNKQQLQAMEQQISQRWDMEAERCSALCKSLNNTQRAILTCARNYYETIKAKATDNGAIDISQLREGGTYAGEYFPHSLKTNELALAWIMNVGDNPDMLKRFFPNQAMPSYAQLKPVHFEGKLYDYNRPGLNEFKQSKTSKDTCVDYRMVLVVLKYLIQCEFEHWDQINSVETKKPGRLMKSGLIDVDTKYYMIYIPFKGTQGHAFDYIDIKPKQAILNRQ